MAHPGDGDLTLLHHLKQRTLNFGRRAVDFVCQQQVGEYRAQRGAEIAGLLVIDACAHQIGRNEVRRELDALELALHRACQGLDRQRLRQSGHPFDQQMALGQHGHHHALKKAVLTYDHPFHFVKNALHQGCAVGEQRVAGCVHGVS